MSTPTHTLFNILLERIMTDALEDHEDTVSIGGRTITKLHFAEDIDGLAGEEQELANLAEHLVGRQHQGMDRPGVRQVPEGSGEQGKMEVTGCEIICGAPLQLTDR